MHSIGPQHGPSFSLSLLIQVHEAAKRQLRWRRAAAMLATSATLLDEHTRGSCVEVRRYARHPGAGRIRLTDHRALRVRRLLLVEVRLRRYEPLRAPHTCPPRQLGAARSCTPGGARQGPVVGHVHCCQQRRPGRVPGLRGISSESRHRQYTVPMCLGVRGPGIAELRNTHVGVECAKPCNNHHHHPQEVTLR